MTEKDGKTFFALSDGSICAAGGKNDGGKAIKAEWDSKYFDFGKPEKEKNVLRLDLSVFPDVSTYSEISWATDRSSHTVWIPTDRFLTVCFSTGLFFIDVFSTASHLVFQRVSPL